VSRPKLHLRCGGIFTADPAVPADPLDRTGLRFCVCGLRGEPGDAHHTAPEPVQDARGLAAGERSEG
jgi:hypothetical protein